MAAADGQLFANEDKGDVVAAMQSAEFVAGARAVYYSQRLSRARSHNQYRLSNQESDSTGSSAVSNDENDANDANDAKDADGSTLVPAASPFYLPALHEASTASEESSLASASLASASLASASSDDVSETVCPILEIPPGVGASGSGSKPVQHALSGRTGLLAICNARSELLLFDTFNPSKPATVTVLPDVEVSFMGWDPRRESCLAIVLRGQGIGLWSPGSGKDLQLWTGFRRRFYKNEKFDPIFAKWSPGNQLVVGLADGAFALWDCASARVFTSKRDKKHTSAVTCGDWLYDATADGGSLSLVLASDAKLMLSSNLCSRRATATRDLKLDGSAQGPELRDFIISVEPPHRKKKASASSPKKQGGIFNERQSFVAPASQKGLHFEQIVFSPSGAFLAVLANPVGDSEAKVVIAYTTSLAYRRQPGAEAAPITVRSGRGICQADAAGGVPRDVVWISEHQVLVSVDGVGGSLQKLSAIESQAVYDICYPAEGEAGPGKLVASAASYAPDIPGVVTAIYVTAEAQGMFVVLDVDLEEIARYPLLSPPVSIRLPARPTEASICFSDGGVMVFELPSPKAELDV